MKKIKYQALVALLVGLMIAPLTLQAQTFVTAEFAQTWQTRNEQRIPGSGGDTFNLTDFSRGPFFTNRLYVGHKWGGRHELRALYAPLELSLNSEFSNSVRFINSQFAANTPTQAFYKFNSYRLTYAYDLETESNWQWVIGFTGKVRDAEVSLKQGALNESKSNVGFVPLAHVRGIWTINDAWTFSFDLDGLAAPQGRAFDLGLFVSHEIKDKNLKLFGGYRTLEGGADNDEVFNFSWFHYATVGLTYQFGQNEFQRGQKNF